MTALAPNLQPVEPHKINPRIDLQLGQIESLLHQDGLPVAWQPALLCPCDEQTTLASAAGTIQGSVGHTRSGCTVCGGRGVLWGPARDTLAIYQSGVRNPAMYEMYGSAAAGAARFTFPQPSLPGFMDKLTLPDAVMVFSEVRTRTASAVESMRFPVVSRTYRAGTVGDPQTAETITSGVLWARRANASGVTQANNLLENVDLRVVNGQIDWTLGDGLGTAPAAGARYSIAYYIHPVYVVRNNPHVLRITRTKRKAPGVSPLDMPSTVDAWLEWMAP